MIISFDFDDTLSQPHIQEFARSLIDCGHELWIVTSRYTTQNRAWAYGINIDNSDLFHVAHDLGIDPFNVRFTNMEPKATFFKDRPEFFMHFEDDPVEIEDLKEIPIITIDVKNSSWMDEAKHHLESGRDKAKE